MSWPHHLTIAVFLATLGACVGSFLNVCVYRLPRGLNLLRPGSRCLGCARAIAARDNIPVAGWILRRGRCRNCGGPIAVRYPLVEAAVGLLFAGAYAADVAATGGDPLEGGLLLPAGL